MIIYPAIDILAGKCVRLKQGKITEVREYPESPLAMAQLFQKQGAKWLSVVDLDGAKNPQNHQHAAISEITHNTNLNIQMGGGVRTGEQIQTLLSTGVKRVILGSVAVTQPETVSQWITEFGPERIVLALDVKLNANNIPMVAVHGWQEISDVRLTELLDFYSAATLKHVSCTDIDCGGTLQGPNFALYQQLKNLYPKIHIQASGGIAALTDIQALAHLQLSGVVVGSALYESKFTLPQAMQLEMTVS